MLVKEAINIYPPWPQQRWRWSQMGFGSDLIGQLMEPGTIYMREGTICMGTPSDDFSAHGKRSWPLLVTTGDTRSTCGQH